MLTRLPILILQPHNRCNCRCIMCDIWKLTDAQEITAAELERHLADIEALKVEWVVFTGGEPLMHSDLFRLAGLLRTLGIKTTILSTGLLLERHAAPIVRTTDEVIVSLDGPAAIHDAIRRVPGAFDRLAQGVRALHLLNPNYPVSARCTVQAANASHLRETVTAARTLGLQSISFLAADTASTAFNRPLVWPEERQNTIAPNQAALEQEIERLIDGHDAFILESPAKLRRIAAHFHSPTPPRCNAPWVSAVLESNGDVRPCFFHGPIGNTSTGTLLAVLNSPEGIAFRQSLDVATDPICRRCVCSLYLSAEAR